MDFDASLKELQAFPKNAELAAKLLALQDETAKAGDADAFLKATTLLTDTYLYMQETDEAVAMLSAVLRDNAFEDYKTIVAIVDKLVQLLLKTEDFAQLETVLEYRSRFVQNVPSQAMMQQFYLSVCYEGLRKYDLAIQSLVKVADNISSANVVSKYLKLAMLYLRTQDLGAAKNAYDHAAVFDKAKKNEMFYLVESDILFAEGRILNALKAYQDFFLRSKSKVRYLDRYITINTRLGNYEEAWRFYKEYEKKASTNVSKNYRLELYEAGLAVAEALHKYEEAAQIREKILQLADKEPEIIDSFDGVKALFEAANRIPADRDRRDVVLETFRSLVKVAELPKLMFVSPAADGILVETFTKGLLLDKTIATADLVNTAIGAVIEADRDYLLLMQNDFGTIVDHVENRPLKDGLHRYLIGLKVRAVGTTAGFIIVYLDRDRHFDYVSKLLVTVRLILESKFDVARLRASDAARLQTAEHVFAASRTGIFRIETGYLFLVDERAKALLETDRAFLPFEEFQARMVGRTLYVDDFVGKRSIDFAVTGFQGRKMVWHATVWTDDASIHFAATDVRTELEQSAETARQAGASFFHGLGSMHALDAAVKAAETQCALSRWTAGGLVEATQEDWDAGCAALVGVLRKAAGTHLKGLFQGEDGSFFALYDTIDKRVLDRIAGETASAAEAAIAQNPRIAIPAVRAGFVNILRNRTLAESIGKLRLAASAASIASPWRHYDRELILWENKTDVVARHLERLIETNGLLPRYAQVGNVFTKKVEMYRVGIHPDPVLGDPDLLSSAVRRFGLSTAVAKTLAGVVLKDMETLARAHPVALRFALPIHPATLLSADFADELVRIAKKRRIPPSRLVLVILPDGIVPLSRIATAVARLGESGCAFGFDGRRTNDAPWGEAIPFEFDYVWIDPRVVGTPAYGLWEAFAQSTRASLVAGPVDDEVQAVAVRNARIGFVEGGLLPTYGSIADLSAVL